MGRNRAAMRLCYREIKQKSEPDFPLTTLLLRLQVRRG